MPGPPPTMKKGFRVLSADGPDAEAPAWPLLPDVRRAALFDVQQDRMANLVVEIEGADDGRTRGRLQRELNKLELANAQLRLEIEQLVDAEKAVWAEMWTMPQAVLWRESRSERVVARYVRMVIAAEQGDLKSDVSARALEKELAITTRALLSARVEIQHVEEAEAKGKRRQPEPTPIADEPDDPRLALVQ